MVMRITNNMKTQNAKDSIFRISSSINDTQIRLLTGKRINKPSDDPVGMQQIISYRTNVASHKQFIRNSEYASNFLTQTDAVVEKLQRIADEARVLAIGQGNSLPNQQQRLVAATQVDMWIDEAASLVNSKFGSRYMFGGQSTADSPIEQSASGVVYVGGNNEIEVEVSDGQFLGLNFVGSDIFAPDLSPDIDSNTLISAFHRGDGVPSGNISITNTLGVTATVYIDSGWTVQEVLDQINSTGIGVTASINSEADGISLTDNNANSTSNLIVQDASGGTSARELGIIGNANQTIEGIGAQPAITASTPVSLLNAGSGISTFFDVNVVNGSSSGTVTFGSPSTVQDILDAFNNSGLNVQATINSVGNGLNVTSTVSGTVAVVTDIGTGTTASVLGLGGGGNLFYTLHVFKEALENNDTVAISALMDDFGSISDHLSSIRGTVGVRDNVAMSSIDSQTVYRDNSNAQVALVENDDFAASATDLASLEVAFNASLATTAQIIQPSLVDFLR